jgi:hypothetical protein
LRKGEKMFWQKKNTTTPIKENAVKLPGPREIPEPIGRFLIVDKKRDSDKTWSLKSVIRPRSDNNQSYDFRVFNDAQAGAAKIRVRDFTSLDEYPDLILYQGWYNKKTYEVHLEE